ncbi:MAG: hypothetical protein JNJ43_10740 [Anaerolineales bacterium]|nr:hypothetical protein [Anaerolineales bacterium]
MGTIEWIFLILGFASMILGVFAMYTPWIHLKHSKRLTGKELGKKYPQHKWMRWGYIILYLGWFGIVYFLFTKVLLSINIFSSISGLFATIGLFMGLFAFITGVNILPTRLPIITFVIGNEAKVAGRFQTIWSTSVLILAIVLELFEKIILR